MVRATYDRHPLHGTPKLFFSCRNCQTKLSNELHVPPFASRMCTVCGTVQNANAIVSDFTIRLDYYRGYEPGARDPKDGGWLKGGFQDGSSNV